VSVSDEVRIRLLGGFEVAAGGRPVTPNAWRLRKAKSVLKLLALAPGHRLHRERICDTLWPDLDPESASNNLHQALHAIRRALGSIGVDAPALVVLRDGVVALGPDGGVTVDLDELEKLAHRASDGSGERAVEVAAESATAAPDYRAALALADQELLPEDVFEPWTETARDVVRERRTALRRGLADSLTRSGQLGEAADVLRALVADDQLHEPAVRALMRVLASDGRRPEALATYERLREALRRDIGADPDPLTRRLYRDLLAGSVEDLDADGAAGSRKASRPHNLPLQTTSFVGRERETAAVDALLGDSRLLTLTGPGGSGKTRLAVAVAFGRVDSHRDGVWFVDLATLVDPELTIPAVASVLDIQLPPRRSGQGALVARLAERELLLVLDNCEHLVDACSALVADILASCPLVTVLATSREPLRAYGEHTWRVPSLALPDLRRMPGLEQMRRLASVKLFVDRVTDVVPDFDLTEDNVFAVAQICFRLDGMPLALELAAARVGMLSPQQIAERLDDALVVLGRGSRQAVTRQQTLLGTLEWSHNLLALDERLLFRRLALFAGSFSLRSAEEVCGWGDGAVPTADVLDVLGRLVDKSLVLVERHGAETRYRLLETIRQYARGRLREAGELDEIDSRHRGYFLALAEAHDPELTARIGNETPLALEVEVDNLRAALGSALAHDPEEALRLAVALWRFWLARGSFAEGRRWLDAALDAAPAASRLRARALVGESVLALRLGDSSRLRAIGEEIVAIHRAERDPVELAYSLHLNALLRWMAGDWDGALAVLDQSGALATAVDEPSVLAVVAYDRAIVLLSRGDAVQAREGFAKSLQLLEGLGDVARPFFSVVTPFPAPTKDVEGRLLLVFEETAVLGRRVGAAQGRGYVLSNAGYASRAAGDLNEARALVEQSVECFRSLGDRHGESLALNHLGHVHRVRGETDRSHECLAASLAIRQQLGDRREVGITLGGLGILALTVGDLGHARALVGRALVGFEETEDGPGTGSSWLHLAQIARAAGDSDTARGLLTRSLEGEHMGGFQRTAGWSAVLLAELAAADGDRAAARSATARARGIFTRLGEPTGLAYLRGRTSRPVSAHRRR